MFGITYQQSVHMLVVLIIMFQVYNRQVSS